MTQKIKRVLAGVAALAALALGGAAIAGATGDGDDDESEQPITGSALDQAKSAALQETGGGTVTETETGDEESLYEVEVTLDDGSQVDVQLDRGFSVVSSSPDGEGDDGAGDD